jgi:putative heme-binding domain-containing protein
MVAGTGEAPCAVMAYESDNLPDEYRGELLVTSWGDHRLERYTLQPRGASFSATMKPVVTGDQNFRPVGLAMAPDGSLFMSDWVDKSYPVHGKGRIWHLRAKNPKKREPLSDDPAVALAHPHRPWRESAARKLTREKAIEVASKAKDERARVTAANRVFSASHDWIIASDTDASIVCRSHFIHFAETVARFDPARTSILAGIDVLAEKQAIGKKLTEEEAQAFETLSGNAFPDDLGQLSRTPELLAALVSVGGMPLLDAQLTAVVESDPWLSLSRYSAKGINHPDGIYRRLTKAFDKAAPALKDPAVQKEVQAFAIALNNEINRSPSSKLWELAEIQRIDDPRTHILMMLLQRSNDPDIRFIGIRWAAETKLDASVKPFFEKELMSLLEFESKNSRNFAAILVALDRMSGRTHENTGEYFAAKFLIGSSKSVPAKIMALRMVSPNHADLSAKFLIDLSKHEDRTLQREAVRALRLRSGDEAITRLKEIVADEKADEQLRCEALLALWPDNPHQQKLLTDLAEQKQFAQLQAEAKRLLVKVEVQQKLDPKDQAAWQKLVEGKGDPAVGERLFFHPKVATCFKCHEYKGRGGRVGPDLTTVAKSMTRERLLQSIVDPSREIAPQFTPWIIQAADGTVKNGVYVGEEVDGKVLYADNEGKIFKLHPRDVEDKKASDKSIMPEGLAATLTAQELRDLLAFLLQP